MPSAWFKLAFYVCNGWGRRCPHATFDSWVSCDRYVAASVALDGFARGRPTPCRSAAFFARKELSRLLRKAPVQADFLFAGLDPDRDYGDASTSITSSGGGAHDGVRAHSSVGGDSDAGDGSGGGGAEAVVPRLFWLDRTGSSVELPVYGAAGPGAPMALALLDAAIGHGKGHGHSDGKRVTRRRGGGAVGPLGRVQRDGSRVVRKSGGDAKSADQEDHDHNHGGGDGGSIIDNGSGGSVDESDHDHESDLALDEALVLVRRCVRQLRGRCTAAAGGGGGDGGGGGQWHVHVVDGSGRGVRLALVLRGDGTEDVYCDCALQ